MFFQTQIKSVKNGDIVDVSGRHLKLMNNLSISAGDVVWTDGNVIFGREHIGSTPLILPSSEGIPVLSFALRGYIKPNGNYKEYNIATDSYVLNDLKNYFHGSETDLFDAEISGSDTQSGTALYKAKASNEGIYLSIAGKVISESQMVLSLGDTDTVLFDLKDMFIAPTESSSDTDILEMTIPAFKTSQVVGFKVDQQGEWDAIIGSCSKGIIGMELVASQTYTKEAFQSETFLWESSESKVEQDVHLKDALINLWEYCLDSELAQISVETYINADSTMVSSSITSDTNLSDLDDILKANNLTINFLNERLDLYQNDVNSSTKIFQRESFPLFTKYQIDCNTYADNGAKAYRIFITYVAVDTIGYTTHAIYKPPPEMPQDTELYFSLANETARETEKNGGSAQDYTAHFNTRKTNSATTFLTLPSDAHYDRLPPIETKTFIAFRGGRRPIWGATKDYTFNHTIPNPVMFYRRIWNWTDGSDPQLEYTRLAYEWHTTMNYKTEEEFTTTEDESIAFGAHADGIEGALKFFPEKVYVEGEAYKFLLTDTQGHTATVWLIRPNDEDLIRTFFVGTDDNSQLRVHNLDFKFPIQDEYFGEWHFRYSQDDKFKTQSLGYWQSLGVFDGENIQRIDELPPYSPPKPQNAYFNNLGNVSLSNYGNSSSGAYVTGYYGGGIYKIIVQNTTVTLDGGLKNFRLRKLKKVSKAKK